MAETGPFVLPVNLTPDLYLGCIWEPPRYQWDYFMNIFIEN